MSVVGIGGALAPISPERLAELRVVQEGFRSVIDEFIANGRTLPLEMSYHAPGNRKAEFKASRRGMSVKIRKNNSKPRNDLSQRPRVGNWQTSNSFSSREKVITSSPTEETRLRTTDGSTDETTESLTPVKEISLQATVGNSSRHSSPGGTNPEAEPFTPASQDKPAISKQSASFKRGVRSPEEFLAQLKSMEITKKIEAAGTDRRIVLKNLPDDAKLTDVFCLIFNGQVDQVTMEGREASVDFISSESAKAYYEKVSGGIRVGEHLITVERGVSPKLTAHIVNCLKTHTTRVVHAIVPSQMTMEQLRDAAKGMNIEHIEYHDEPDKDPRAYFFFTGISDGYEMMRKLIIAPEWSGSRCSPNFLADPCTAAWFHTNTLNASPLASATVVEATPEAIAESEGQGDAEAEAGSKAGSETDSNGWEIKV